MNQKDQKSLFQQAMEGVTPLKTKQRHIDNTPAEPTIRHKHSAYQCDKVPDNHMNHWIIPDHIELLNATDVLFYVKDSLPAKLIRQLKRGQIPKQAELDLHGYTAAEAADALHEFLHHSHHRNKQLVHIIHGKGSISSGAKLKTYVNYWLADIDYVLAFCSAQPKDGGTGCLYVLLKRQNL